MNLKYLGIVAVFIVIVVLGVKYAKAPVVVEEEGFINIEPKHVLPTMPMGELLEEGEADPNVMKLDMKAWRWIRTEMNDGSTIVAVSDKFKLTFKNDGTFSASTDCNGVGGEYKVGADKTLTFTNMMSTLMFCEKSQETEFRQVLENASSYFFTSRGELIIELKYDSGTATFR